MNKKGFILVSSYMVLAVLIILATGFATKSIGEQRVAAKERDTVQALWLAEAGVDRAMTQLPTLTGFSAALGTGAYSVADITNLGSNRYLIVSTGGVPATAVAPNNAIRIVRAVVEQPVNDADPSDITAAITANGEVDVKGSAVVNGIILENTMFDFEEIFGVPKSAVENNADHTYTDPDPSVTPVDSLTWINTVTDDTVEITASGWTGSGILVVDGNMKITGGHFTGIIWVMGTLHVSGNPIIDGTIFVESGADIETSLTGNPTVSYDAGAISEAFGHLPSDLPPYIVNWKED